MKTYENFFENKHMENLVRCCATSITNIYSKNLKEIIETLKKKQVAVPETDFNIFEYEMYNSIMQAFINNQNKFCYNVMIFGLNGVPNEIIANPLISSGFIAKDYTKNIALMPKGVILKVINCTIPYTTIDFIEAFCQDFKTDYLNFASNFNHHIYGVNLTEISIEKTLKELKKLLWRYLVDKAFSNPDGEISLRSALDINTFYEDIKKLTFKEGTYLKILVNSTIAKLYKH
ncbi:MAG: hypothetical protein RSE00_02655 [Clostridia bacterium]